MEWENSALGNLFVPDVLTPEQFYDSRRDDSTIRPVKKLMMAILEDALRCFQNNADAKGGPRKRLFSEAEQWLIGEGGEGPFSFETVCETLGNRAAISAARSARLAHSAACGRIDAAPGAAFTGGPQRPYQRSGASRRKTHSDGQRSLDHICRREFAPASKFRTNRKGGAASLRDAAPPDFYPRRQHRPAPHAREPVYASQAVSLRGWSSAAGAASLRGHRSAGRRRHVALGLRLNPLLASGNVLLPRAIPAA